MWLIRRRSFLALAAIFITTGLAMAQADSCPAIVKTALEAVDESCTATGRNQVCYGNIQLDATPRENTEAFSFTQPGDRVDVAALQQLSLSALDAESAVWGIALMKLQANLPASLPGQNVTFLLFGDVEINAEEGNTDDSAPPLQAFYFKSGLNDAPCAEAPDSGILVQTPDGEEKIDFTVDEVAVTLGSTAYLQAQPGGEMTVSVLEGEATLEANGVTVIVPAGSRARVPIDDDLRASGPPVGPEPYDPDELAALPIGLLERAVTIAIEATPEATGEPPAGGSLMPAAGQWAWANGAPTAEGCPAGTGDLMAMRFQPAAPFSLPGDAFDILILFNAAFGGGGEPPNAVFTTPDANTYVIDFNDGGGDGRYEVRVISDSRIEGLMSYTSQGCAISIPFEVTRVGS